jgi:hypothetical protein
MQVARIWRRSWNEAAETLFGWCEADVLGVSMIDVLAPGAGS